MLRSIFKLKVLSLFALVTLLVACRNDRSVDVSQIDLTIQSYRFEKDLKQHVNEITFLKNRYGKFFDLFVNQLLHLATPDSIQLKSRLKDFVNDPDITDIYSTADSIYNDFSQVDTRLTDALRHYKYFFPHKVVPQVATYISGFNYAIVCTDSLLGIGIDMYLGVNSPYYPAINLPQFKIKNMQKDYIVADAMRGWAQSEWEESPSNTDLLSHMIYSGKVLYFLNNMLPETPDSIKTGYTKAQLDWVRSNEKKVWAFFVDNRLLFASDQNQIGKFVSEGPTTNGFPKESPGNIGQWIGLQIVESYMKNHSKVTLSELIENNDYKSIFNEAKYKPKK